MSVQKTRKTSIDMTVGNPIRLMVLFAIPMWIGGVFQLMYNMVDTIVVGRFVSTDALAAIGATSSTTAFILFLGNGVTNTLSVIVAQAEGAKQAEKLKKVVAHAAYLVVAAGIFLGLVSSLIARPLMQLLGTDPLIIDDSVTYIRIVSGLTIAQMCYNGSAAILRAIGDSKTPLYFLIFSSLLNIVLDLAFVLGLGAGVAGVAWATILSQLLSGILCITYMLRKYERLRPNKAAWKYDPALMGEFLRIGLPLVVQSVTLNIGMFVITAVINSFGKDVMAAYTIGSRVEHLATVTFSNIAFSFSVFSGQNFGAHQYERIRSGYFRGSALIVALTLLSTAVMMVFARPLALLFMDEPQELVLTEAVKLIRIEASMYILLGTIWGINSVLRGMGAVKITLISSIVELASKIGLSLLLPIFWGTVGVWLAAPIGWGLGIIPTLGFFLWWAKDPENRCIWLKKKKEEPVRT
ncbi:MAG: MATE family efflux transporter [Firmicutes bacterium]|nr:MATE family efflux transporter [Bacillota bacterium]